MSFKQETFTESKMKLLLSTRLIMLCLILGMICSLYGAGKAAIALHLNVFSQDFSKIEPLAVTRVDCPIAVIVDAKNAKLVRDLVSMSTKFSSLGLELSKSEFMSCSVSFVLFCVAFVGLCRQAGS